MRARYWGKNIKKWVYKTFKSRASMNRAKQGLKNRKGIKLKPLPRKRKIRFARRWR